MSSTLHCPKVIRAVTRMAHICLTLKNISPMKQKITYLMAMLCLTIILSNRVIVKQSTSLLPLGCLLTELVGRN